MQMTFRLFDRRAKTAPSSYPRVPFHVLRTFQLIASLIVGAIMCFFIWHLTHDHWNTPWTFIWLTSASLFSIAALCSTIVLHCLFGLNPRLNLAINGFLSLLWVLSWTVLTIYISGTLAHVCDYEHWNEKVGIMVCRIYKALFTFALVGMVSTIAGLALDIYVYRLQTRRGIYRLQDLGAKPRSQYTRGSFTDEAAFESPRGYRQDGLAASRSSGSWSEPRLSMGPYSERAGLQQSKAGYSAPDNQFDYDAEHDGGHDKR
ncbi:hypothetical protein Tdes44962_MAKER02368 [Teratosphaeria destructans]|uniref:MARVEL domain-containing protein n=1 Tax=Teratosphaeria destructans TaxID=418781 RepID=A0A9W7STV8_9PEZI|nr:hypothetical protein Tdes44962_MAKER02368 [Teratosphaeria destructans]